MICKKCGNEFPNWVEIDGKKRNIQNRKYCLDCSPFGTHNTKQIEKLQSDEEEKLKKKRANRVKAVQRRRDKVKQMAVDYKGGKCICCGYNKYAGALEFHHLDPDEKEFSLSAKGHCRSWEAVKEELDKCVLVCSNCHKEIHAGLINLEL